VQWLLGAAASAMAAGCSSKCNNWRVQRHQQPGSTQIRLGRGSSTPTAQHRTFTPNHIYSKQAPYPIGTRISSGASCGERLIKPLPTAHLQRRGHITPPLGAPTKLALLRGLCSARPRGLWTPGAGVHTSAPLFPARLTARPAPPAATATATGAAGTRHRATLRLRLLLLLLLVLVVLLACLGHCGPHCCGPRGAM